MQDFELYRGAYTGPQVDAALARATEGGALDREIEALKSAVGSPLVANTVADMTDTNKVYVYTGSEVGYTAGHWYYFDGEEWADGGVYDSNPVSIDATLSIEGDAADAKATGDAIASVDEKATEALREAVNAYPVQSASGGVASFDDGADEIPVKAMTVEITPQQTGDPTPDAPQTITGFKGVPIYREGKNIINYADVIPGTSTTVTLLPAQNGFEINSNTAGAYRSARIEFPKLRPGVAYTLSADVLVHSGAVRLAFYNTASGSIERTVSAADTAEVQTLSLTYTPTSASVRCQFYVTAGTSEDGDAEFYNVQLEVNSERTDFEPFAGDRPSIIDPSTATVFSNRGISEANRTWTTNNNARSYGVLCKPNTTYKITADNENITVFRVGTIATDFSTATVPAPLLDMATRSSPGSIYLTTSPDAQSIIVQISAAIVDAGTTGLTIQPLPYVTIDLPSITYGGTLDVITGELTVTRVCITVDGTEAGLQIPTGGTSNWRFLWNMSTAGFPVYKSGTPALSSHFGWIPVPQPSAETTWGVFTMSTDQWLVVYDNYTGDPPAPHFATLDEFKAWLADQVTAGTPVQFCYELETPTTVMVSPTEIKTLLGDNTIFSETGDVSLTYRADTTLLINKILSALNS